MDGVVPGRVELDSLFRAVCFSLGFFQSVFPTVVFMSGFFSGGCGAASSYVLCQLCFVFLCRALFMFVWLV